MKRKLLWLLVAAIGQLLSGCVVYMPMQCAAPQITGSKQAEISGSSYLNGRVEVAGTYSPLPHLLLRAAHSSKRDNSADSSYYRSSQYDLGLGTYWPLSLKWLVGGLGGFGQARGAAGYYEGGLLLGFGQPVRHDFETRYRKVFGEAYAIFQPNDVLSLGLAYRVTQVNFTALTDRASPVNISAMTRSEPMFFLRARLGEGPAEVRPVQLQLAWGTSATFGYNEKAPNQALSSERGIKQGRGYMTLGISIFPHCLFGHSK